MRLYPGGLGSQLDSQAAQVKTKNTKERNRFMG
jgi:hypothetical protein